MEHQLTTQPMQKQQTSKSSLQVKTPERSVMHPALRLQRAVGNQAVQNMVRSIQVNMQAKPYTGMHESSEGTQISPIAAPILQRKCACGGTPGPDGECAACRAKRLAMQRLSSSTNEQVTGISPAVQSVLKSPGQPLPQAARSFMEPLFGQDFSRVRVHINTQASESARAVNALAYTMGPHIVFGSGSYAPETAAGKKLLAHELAHVVQQSSGLSFMAQGMDHGPDDPLERAADQQASAVTSMNFSTPSLGTSAPARTASLVRASIPQVQRQVKNSSPEVNQSIQSPGENQSIQPAEMSQPAQEPSTQKPQDAFQPNVTGKDSEQLIQTMLLLQNIRPSEYASGMYTLLFQGRTITLSQAQVDQVYKRIKQVCRANMERIKSEISDAQHYYTHQKKAQEEYPITSSIVRAIGYIKTFGELSDPGPYLQHYVSTANAYLAEAEKALEENSFVDAGEFIAYGETNALQAEKLSKAYVQGLISTGEMTVTGLEYTRNISFVTLGVLAIIATGGAAAAGSGAVTTTTAFGFEVGTATAANVIATGAPIVATLGSAGVQAALGDKVDWTKVGVDIAVNLILSKFGGNVSNKLFTAMLGNSSVRSIGAVAFGRIFSSLATHELSTAFTTSVDFTYRKLKGQNVTWNQFINELLERLLDPKGLIFAGIMGAVVAGADVKFGGAKGIDIFDKQGKKIGNIDEVRAGVIIENKTAEGIGTINPKTGKPFPGSDEGAWAQNQIYGKTKTRIDNLKDAAETRAEVNIREDPAQAAGSSVRPSIKELQGVRKYEFQIKADTPSLRIEVEAQMNRLRKDFPDWTFTAVFGK